MKLVPVSAFVLAALLAPRLAIAVPAAAPPSQSVVKAQIAKVLGNQLEFHSVQIAPGRKILNADAGALGIPPGTIIYPVLAKYTEHRKNGIVQDVTQYWYVYRDDFGWASQMVAHSQNHRVERT